MGISGQAYCQKSKDWEQGPPSACSNILSYLHSIIPCLLKKIAQNRFFFIAQSHFFCIAPFPYFLLPHLGPFLLSNRAPFSWIDFLYLQIIPFSATNMTLKLAAEN